MKKRMLNLQRKNKKNSVYLREKLEFEQENQKIEAEKTKVEAEK